MLFKRCEDMPCLCSNVYEFILANLIAQSPKLLVLRHLNLFFYSATPGIPKCGIMSISHAI